MISYKIYLGGYMKYNVMLTQEKDVINAFVLGMPKCNVKSRSRKEAISLIQKNLLSILNQSEIVQIEIPYQDCETSKASEWKNYGYGSFKNDSTWTDLFDEIELNRNNDITEI